MKVLGMKKETYTGKICEGHNCNFTYKDAELERHHLYIEDRGTVYQLSLEISSGECGSGWTTAESVEVSLDPIAGVPENMIPCKIKTEFEMINPDSETYECDVFKFDVYGGDRYYPCGSYFVDESLFGKQ